MKLLTLLVCLLFTSSCMSNSQNRIDSTEVLTQKIEVLEDNGVCYLRHNKTLLKLQPSPPCFILKDETGEAQYYPYEKINNEATLLVIGTPLSTEQRHEWNLENSLQCGLDAQGILLNSNKLTVTDKVLESGVICNGLQVDEKVFYYFAHE